jgi:hypothetical protein
VRIFDETAGGVTPTSPDGDFAVLALGPVAPVDGVLVAGSRDLRDQREDYKALLNECRTQRLD